MAALNKETMRFSLNISLQKTSGKKKACPVFLNACLLNMIYLKIYLTMLAEPVKFSTNISVMG